MELKESKETPVKLNPKGKRAKVQESGPVRRALWAAKKWND